MLIVNGTEDIEEFLRVIMNVKDLVEMNLLDTAIDEIDLYFIEKTGTDELLTDVNVSARGTTFTIRMPEIRKILLMIRYCGMIWNGQKSILRLHRILGVAVDHTCEILREAYKRDRINQFSL